MAGNITGVRATHEDYDEYAPVWEKMSDVIEGGTRELHEEREKYLPRYNEEDDDNYDARLKRTPTCGFSFRTAIGCRGLLLRKPAVVKTPPSVTPMLDDVTLSGMPMPIFIGEICEEILTTGRVGVWVNFPDATAAGTLADAAVLNLRPSLHKLEAESVTNWATRRVNNETKLSLVVMKEEFCTPSPDGFTTEEQDRFRVLDLIDVPNALGGVDTVYRVRVMMYDKEANLDVTLNEFIPIMQGKPISYIPFYFISPDCVGPDVDAPPFEDLVQLELTHYELTSSMLNGCYWSGLPQVFVSGYTPESGQKLTRSPASAWCFPTVGTKVALVEVGVAGFSALEKELDRLEKQMVLIGSRSLELQAAGGNEAMSTAQLHLSAEHSVLAGIGQSISSGLTAALKTFVAWTGNEIGDTKCVLSKDFFTESLTPQARDSIVKSWQAKAISDEAKFSMLKAGGDFEPDTTFEDEQSKPNTAPVKAAAPQPNTQGA